ncbi:MFS transporter, partial [Candidatus Bathyarchaeota archaeon]|nr:MFS transporter [Candidatus Bathyarchaeota archaeon]
SMGAWRAPTVALMPDFVAPRDRSKGNGIVNFLGGFGAIFAFVVGGLLITDDNPFPGFLLVSIVMLLALVILFLGVKEPDTRNWDFSAESEDDKISIITSIKQVAREPDKSTLFMLMAIFCWFLAYQGLEALWTVYSGEFFGLDRGAATFSLTFVALPFMLFAVPAGLIAKKITRRWTIICGLVIGTIAFLVLEFIKGDMAPVYVLFPVFGIAWALININSIAMIWQMAPSAKHIGTYTGLYYFFSFLAAIVGPTVLGFFMDYVVGRENMFVICVAFFLLAIFFMTKVKRGEPELTDEEREARQAAINRVDRE